MKSFKTFLNENTLATAAAALGIAGSAMAAPPKPEATDYIVDKMKKAEGFRPVAEKDKDASGNPVVIGYGTTHVYPDSKKAIKVGDKVSQEGAEQLIKDFIVNDLTPKMEKIPGWDEMDAGKQAALMSFAYNTGQGFYGSKGYETITDVLKNKNWDEVPSAFRLYNKGGGKVLPGLVTRREEEGKLWSGGFPSKEEAPKASSKETPKETPKAAPKETPKPSSTEHTVSKGETLSAIAKKYGVTVDELVKRNPSITNPNLIKPDQKIKIK